MESSDQKSYTTIAPPESVYAKLNSNVYLEKYNHLLEYYNHIAKSNNRLRHRIYHVKKEINHLKRLKRVLCDRLMRNNAVLVDFNLEIPDVESSLNRSTATAISSSVTNLTSANGNMDKIIGEVASSASTLPAKKRRKTDTGDSLKRRESKSSITSCSGVKLSADSNTERNIIAIIDSVVNETHKSSVS